MLLSLLVQLLTQDDLIQLPNKTTLLTRYTGDDQFTGDECIPGYYKSKLVFHDDKMGICFKAQYNNIPGKPGGVAFTEFL